MSKPAIIIGLIIGTIVHVFMLIPFNMPASSIQTASPARIAVRELPRQDDETRLVEHVAQKEPEPAPETRPKPVPRTEEVPGSETTLTRVETPRQSPLTSQGDFAGKTEGARRASLRIDWGSPQQAHEIVLAADMRLVMLGGSGVIAGEAIATPEGWQRVDAGTSDLSSYSNRVRIVDSTPAFLQAASLCTGSERLAVLLPLSLEHSLRTQQIRAAAEAGVDSSGIRAFYGRFRIDGGRVAFDISSIERRSS